MTSSSTIQKVQQQLEGAEARRETMLDQLAEVNDQAKFDSQRCKQLEKEVRHLSLCTKLLDALSARLKLLQKAGIAEAVAAELLEMKGCLASLYSFSASGA